MYSLLHRRNGLHSDTCRRWYHYDCVGILPDAVPGEGEKWICVDCRPGEGLASAVSNLQLCLKSVLEQMATMRQEIAARPSVSVPEGQQLADAPPPAAPSTSTAPPPVTTTPTPVPPPVAPKPPRLPAPAVSAAAAVPEDVIIGGAIVGPDTCQRALQGRYIDFATLLTYPSASRDEHVTLRDGQLRISGKMDGRAVTSFQLWLKAWGVYEELLMLHHPRGAALYPALAAHRRAIQEAQELHKWKAVYSYDTAFRLDLARRRSFDFDQMDMRLYISNLNAKTLRDDAAKCHRCQSTGHQVRDCPFPEGQPSTLASKKKVVCNNYNDKTCTYPSCSRLHVCRRCHGPQPASKCECSA